jgi:hypothetical protein
MRRAVRSSLLAAVVAAAATLAAAPAAAADERDTREAKERFEEGLARAKIGDWEGARRSFQQSIAVVPSQTALFNLALAEEKCARPVDATVHFKEYTRKFTLTDDERAQAQRHITELAAKIGHIEVQAPSGTALTLDGSLNAGIAPLSEPLDVAPGHHTIEAMLSQGAKSLGVDAVAGQVAHLAFSADGTSPAAAQGPPAAGEPASAPTPPAAQDSPAAASEQAATARSSTARIVTVAALGGTAIIAGALGLYFGAQSNSDSDSVKTLQADPNCKAGCAPLQSAIDSANSEHTTADGLFVTSAVLAAAAVGVWILWPKPPAAAASVRVVPLVWAGGAAGASAIATF